MPFCARRKVVIYTGLLPVTQTEEALAVVIGHGATLLHPQ